MYPITARRMASSPPTSTRLEWIGSAIDLYQGRLIRFAAGSQVTWNPRATWSQDTFLACAAKTLNTCVTTLRMAVPRLPDRALDVRKKEGPLQTLDDA